MLVFQMQALGLPVIWRALVKLERFSSVVKFVRWPILSAWLRWLTQAMMLKLGSLKLIQHVALTIRYLFHEWLGVISQAAANFCQPQHYRLCGISEWSSSMRAKHSITKCQGLDGMQRCNVTMPLIKICTWYVNFVERNSYGAIVIPETLYQGG